MSKNTALFRLYCNSNQLTAIDVSSNTGLEDLDCGYNLLTTIDLSNNTALYNLYIREMPSLTKVCVWELPFPPAGVFVYAAGSPNVVYSVECNEGFVYIPDANFKAALINSGVDTSGDSKISYEEAAAITTLDVSAHNIGDLTGIEAFINLLTLNCSSNLLSSLDVSNLTGLLVLDCGGNLLTFLDVTGNLSLSELYCASNQLSSLDLSNNSALTKLSCYLNLFSSLDVSDNTLLSYLDCGAGQLSSLNAANNPNLTELYCANNQLTSLDLSGSTALIHLECFTNQIGSLDISNHSDLNYLHCGDNLLTSLDVSNNTAITYMNIGNMPTLAQVCVWELPFPPAAIIVDASNSPNVVYTNSCGTGIQGNPKVTKEMNLYPNPANDLVFVNLSVSGKYILEITDISGTSLYHNANYHNNEEIRIAEFSKGVYFVRVQTRVNTFISKLLIQ